MSHNWQRSTRSLRHRRFFLRTQGLPLRRRRGNQFGLQKLFLKGWCSFGESNLEIDSATAEGIGNHVVMKLPEKFKNVIDKVSAPYFKNRQTTIFLKEPVAPQLAWELCSVIRDVIEQHHLNYKGRKLTCAMDNPPWKRERNGLLAKCSRIVQQECDISEDRLHLDWAAGTLYLRQGDGIMNDLVLGRVQRGTWSWTLQSFRTAFPNIDIATLRLAESSI